MVRFQIRLDRREVELPEGEFLIGRSADCDLVLDDPMVSRRHCVLRASEAKLEVEDLNSRNGVEVNGRSRRAATPLADGDLLTVGSNAIRVRMVSEEAEAAPLPRPRRARELRATLEMGAQSTALGTRSVLIEKAFAIGRFEDVEHILRPFVANTLTLFEQRPADPELLAEVTRYALRVGEATGRGAWLDAVFQLHRAAAAVMPTVTVDELHRIVRRVRYAVSPALREYLEWLKEPARPLGPAERFALQRLEGLVRVLSA